MSALLGGLCVLLAFVEGEITSQHGDERTLLSDVIRGVNLTLSALEAVLTYKFYRTRLRIRIADGSVDDRSTPHSASLFVDQELWPLYLLELAIALVVAPPGLYFRFWIPTTNPNSGDTSLSEVCFGLTCLRAYHFFHVLYWRLCTPRDSFHL